MLAALEVKFGPALSMGYLTSNCDLFGRLAYRITDEGKMALAARQGPGNGQATAKPPPDPAAVRAYEESRVQWRTWLGGQTPLSVETPSELGAIPLSCGIWWESACRPRSLLKERPAKRRPTAGPKHRSSRRRAGASQA
jgi:hypothetical protein